MTNKLALMPPPPPRFPWVRRTAVARLEATAAAIAVAGLSACVGAAPAFAQGADLPGLIISKTSVTVNEKGAGNTETYTVRLDESPGVTQEVELLAFRGHPNFIKNFTVTGLPYTFNSVTWSQPQTVTVTGKVDTQHGVDHTGLVEHVLKQGTTEVVADDDFRITVNQVLPHIVFSKNALYVPEEGDREFWTVRLSEDPYGDAYVGLDWWSRSDMIMSRNALDRLDLGLDFGSDNWNVPQRVELRATTDDYRHTTQPIEHEFRIFNLVFNRGTSLVGVQDLPMHMIPYRSVSTHYAYSPWRGPPGLYLGEGGSGIPLTFGINFDPGATALVVTATPADATVARVTPGTLTFTQRGSQSIDVFGEDDDVDQLSSRTTKIDVSHTGSDYSNVRFVCSYSCDDYDAVFVYDDDDRRGLNVSAQPSFTMTEGDTLEYTVALTSDPVEDVTVAITNNQHTRIHVVDPDNDNLISSLTFTTDGWDTAQRVKLTVQHDDKALGDVVATIAHDPSGGVGSTYDDVGTHNLSVTVEDPDQRRLILPARQPAQTVDEGGSTSYTVALGDRPSGDVRVNVSVSAGDKNLISLAPEQLRFTPDTWDVAQTVTITAADDDIDNGYRNVVIANDARGGGYGDVPTAYMEVRVGDEDVAGTTVSESGVSMAENGGSATYTVVLNSQPEQDVTVTAASDDTTIATVTPATLTFTPATWDTPQTFTVSGVDDDIDNLNQQRGTRIQHEVSRLYTRVPVASVGVTVTDDDLAPEGLVLVAPEDIGGKIEEGDGTVALGLQRLYSLHKPLTVTVSASTVGGVRLATPGASGDYQLTTTEVTFPKFERQQPVNLTIADDALVEGPETIVLLFSWSDGKAEVGLTLHDNDVPELSLSKTTAVVGSKGDAGAADTWTVVMDNAPTVDITVAITPDDTDLLELSPSAVGFGPTTWNIARTITATSKKVIAPTAAHEYT